MQQGELAGLVLLVVEDEFLVADFIAETAIRFGARVIGPAANEEQARELLKGARIDGAVLDVRLGGHTSLALADELQAAGVPLIFATGYAASLAPERYSAVTRLKKPFRQEEFLAAALTAFAQPLAQSRGA